MDFPNPTLSVAIPTFNRKKELVECLNSIVPQARRLNVRIYISDNASDYDLSEILEGYRRSHPLIYYHRNEVNLGLDANVRKVISMAESKYVWVFSDDDTMVEGALDLVIPLCETGSYALILPDRELRSNDLSRSLGLFSNINGVAEPTVICDPVALFVKYGYWHYTFVGSLLVRLADWYSVDKSKYVAFPWFEHTCILAECMLGRKALVLPHALIRIRSDNNSYKNSWWWVWVKHFPYALAALPAEYSPQCRRKVLSDFVRISRFSPFLLMLLGRSEGCFSWRNGREILGPFFRLRSLPWSVAGSVVLLLPRPLSAGLIRWRQKIQAAWMRARTRVGG